MCHIYMHWGVTVGGNSLHGCVCALIVGSFPPLLQDFDGPAPGLCYVFLSQLSTKNRDVTLLNS